MKKQKLSLLTISIILIITTLVALIITSAVGTRRIQYENYGANQPIEIIGSYQIDGGSWQELTKDTRFDMDAYHTVTVKGSFSRDIPEGQELLFYIPRLFVSLRIDGSEIYAFGQDGSHLGIFKSPGTAWADYLSPGISSGAEIELIMRNSYTNTNIGFGALLISMQTGTRSGLYERMITDNGSILFASMFFIFISAMALLFTVIAHLWHIPHASKAATLSLFAVSGAMLTSFDLNYLYIPFLITNPILTSLFDITPVYLMPCAFVLTMYTYAGDWALPVIRKICVVQCSMTVIMFILQLSGIVQLYEAQPFFLFVLILTGASSFSVIFFDAYKHENSEAKLMLMTMIPAVVGGMFDICNYYFSITRPRVVLATGASVTIMLQILQILYMIKRSNDTEMQRQRLETELTQSRIAVVLSQIQPHFLYNTLTGIRCLCTIDANEARDALAKLSKYLRANMDSLSLQIPIPFKKELEHVEIYLSLEKMRFGDMLDVVFDIKVHNFSLPALTLQPIVENAVRYGITKKDNGGTVTVTTREIGDAFVITVVDDGNGFDMEIQKNDGNSHIGINNVRSRLAIMCGGTLDISSILGAGTTAVITIPKEDKTE